MQYILVQDLHYNKRGIKRPAGVNERVEYYGQIQSLFVITLPPSPVLGTTKPTTLALAAVRQVNIIGRSSAGLAVSLAQQMFGALDVVDIQSLDWVVGRVLDRGKDVFIDRFGSRFALDISDDAERAERPFNPRQKK